MDPLTRKKSSKVMDSSFGRRILTFLIDVKLSEQPASSCRYWSGRPRLSRWRAETDGATRGHIGIRGDPERNTIDARQFCLPSNIKDVSEERCPQRGDIVTLLASKVGTALFLPPVAYITDNRVEVPFENGDIKDGFVQ